MEGVFEWGSMQTKGSSGGPVIANFGNKPKIVGIAAQGSKHCSTLVIGASSYGYPNGAGVWVVHLSGASIFGRNSNFPSRAYRDSRGKNWGARNIGALMDYACSIDHFNWKAGGYCRSAN